MVFIHLSRLVPKFIHWSSNSWISNANSKIIRDYLVSCKYDPGNPILCETPWCEWPTSIPCHRGLHDIAVYRHSTQPSDIEASRIHRSAGPCHLGRCRRHPLSPHGCSADVCNSSVDRTSTLCSPVLIPHHSHASSQASASSDEMNTFLDRTSTCTQ